MVTGAFQKNHFNMRHPVWTKLYSMPRGVLIENIIFWNVCVNLTLKKIIDVEWMATTDDR